MNFLKTVQILAFKPNKNGILKLHDDGAAELTLSKEYDDLLALGASVAEELNHFIERESFDAKGIITAQKMLRSDEPFIRIFTSEVGVDHKVIIRLRRFASKLILNLLEEADMFYEDHNSKVEVEHESLARVFNSLKKKEYLSFIISDGDESSEIAINGKIRALDSEKKLVPQTFQDQYYQLTSIGLISPFFVKGKQHLFLQEGNLGREEKLIVKNKKIHDDILRFSLSGSKFLLDVEEIKNAEGTALEKEIIKIKEVSIEKIAKLRSEREASAQATLELSF